MLLEINRDELISLITRYDILTYNEILGQYGDYYDQSGKTYWHHDKFKQKSEQDLYALYVKLKNYKPYDRYETAHARREKEIREVEMILAQGLARGSESQVKAAQVEIERLKKLPLSLN